MSQKKEKHTNVIIKNNEKWEKFSYVMLWGLIISIPLSLLFSWMSGEQGITPVSNDTFFTRFIQNYNYILVSLILIPVIAYIFSRIKEELNKRFITDDRMFIYGFIGFILVLSTILFVCTAVYPINSLGDTYVIGKETAELYGIEPGPLKVGYGTSATITVTIFLIFVSTFVALSAFYGVLKISSMKKTKGELRTSIIKYLPIILMVMFIIWTFISCMLAPDAVDTMIKDPDKLADMVLGEKSAELYETASEKADAVEASVLSKALNGCYNLKDGFWAFLTYGSVLIGTMLISKGNVKFKKNLIIGFVIVISILSIATLFVTNYYNAAYSDAYSIYSEEYMKAYEKYYSEDSGEYSFTLTKGQFMKEAKEKAEEEATENTKALSKKLFIYPQRGVFRNSNHFAYVLCIAVLAAAGLTLVEKQIWHKLLYLIAFVILTAMLIVNNTFGAYLGVLVALICMLIYSIAAMFFNQKDDIKNRTQTFVFMLIIVALFTTISLCIRNSNNNIIAVQNIKGFVKDVNVFGGYMLTEENPTEVDVNTLDDSIAKAGSERGRTWIKVWELIKQRPMFGYGLECLLFQFSGQFGVGEGRTHNLLLQLLATVGIPGTLMYFTALAIVFIRLVKNWKTWDDIEKICVFVGIAYMITALTGNSTYYTSPYFMMFLGFVVLTPWTRNYEKEESVVKK